MDELALARLDVIESKIKALETEYKAIYKELTGMEPTKEEAEKQKCAASGKDKPLTEFYTGVRHGREYVQKQCKECQKIHRTLAVEGKRKEGSTISRARTKTKVKRNFELINDTQNQAAANGMSYGQWVAQQYMKRRKEDEEKIL